MKLVIDKSIDNNLLKRKEIMACIDHTSEKTPSKDEIAGWISKEMKTDECRVYVNDVRTDTGMPFSRASVFVWEAEQIRKKGKKERDAEKKESKTEEKSQ